jgi:hypothetical protein
MPDFKLFGIRHHGPGSSKALLSALEDYQPDYILVEGPPDADHLIPWVKKAGMTPPVALLVYNPKDLKQASYFPFAVFSPEWQAMSFALSRQIPVRFMDLPLALSFTLDKTASQQGLLPLDAIPAHVTPERIHRDPLAYLATLAGYPDSERWWDATFEQTVNGAEVFELLLTMMITLRQELNRAESDETLYREAWMRRTIRQVLKEGYQKVAVVCGAWHTPALFHLGQFPDKSDAQLLKGIKKSPVTATWAPWSYDRISAQHEYGAGVVSPAWYELLFHNREEASIRWLTQTARLLREEDMDASSAHIIDALRLAETLAVLRQRSIPALKELKEAALSIFCRGDEAPLQLIQRRLVIGDVTGSIPGDAPLAPLLQDLEAGIRSARLSKEYETSLPVEKSLDLRKDTQLAASQLLHRLLLLEIPWGSAQQGPEKATGSFHEHWLLHWLPDFAIRIIEAGIWGNTLRDAATARLISIATAETRLSQLADYTAQSLKSDLPEAMEVLVKRLEDTAALTTDVLLLMDTLLPLVEVIRYGSTRRLNIMAVEQLIHHLIPRICIGLPGACLHTGEDLSKEILQKIQSVHRAIHLLDQPGFPDAWFRALALITQNDAVNGLLAGGTSRILFDKGIRTATDTAVRMRYALSPANDRQYAVLWLEGFLSGSGLLLIHQPLLWQILDDWVQEIPMEDLHELLPLLRRTFSRFSPPERQKILDLAANGPVALAADENFDLDMGRAAAAMGVVLRMIGD